MNKAIETAQNVLAELLKDQAKLDQHKVTLADNHAAVVLAGNDEQAEALEAEIQGAERKLARLAIQVEAARKTLAKAEAEDAKANAVKATKDADAIADRAAAKLNAMEPLAAQLAEIVDALSKDCDDWSVARRNAQHLGGTPKQYQGDQQASTLFNSIVGNGKRFGRIMGAFSAESVR